MLILLDMDDVLADFERGFLGRWRKKYPRSPFIPIEQRTVFFLENQYPQWCRPAIKRLIRAPGFFLNLEPVAGAPEAVAEMTALGHRVFICSSPRPDCPNCALEKILWVERHLGADLAGRLILTGDKTLVRGDILIDDKPEITGALAPVWEHVLFDFPYNRRVAGKRRLTWADWRQVLGI